MSDRVSPLGADFRPGKYGNMANGVGVTLSQPDHVFLGELAAFANGFDAVGKLVTSIKGKDAIAFRIAANRWFIAGPDGAETAFAAKLKPADGSLIDLSHGRTALRISGPKAEWVLAKLYAIDFSLSEFPAGSGLSTAHHNIFTQIFRNDDETFTLFVFRSFARAFWHTLQQAAAETGYEVA